jgi:uncharacterized surface protein with fasciclin (FAS1) repeats
METAQSRITESRATSREAAARHLILLARRGHLSEQKTVEGGVLKLAVNGGVTVNDATVIQADVEAENGHPRHRPRVLIPAA